MREMHFLKRLRYNLVRKTFSGQYRVQFYDALRFLIENRQKLKPSLEKMRNAWTNFGQNWHPYVELTDDCIDALRELWPLWPSRPLAGIAFSPER